ncbi:transporter substrate-binding domain-containing protein [Paraburkholderia sp.]|uniref:transporter substrate-binding domain-containing protein n=1 Tax=Paraburkholderia sp. TaxID=1926495 RepID=UPI003C7D6AD0
MAFAKLLAASVVSMCMMVAANADTVLKIGTVIDQAPFEYRDSNGNVAGLEVGLGEKMCEIMKVKCEWVTMDFDALIPALKAKKVDAVFSQMTITKERQQTIDFSNPVTSALVQYVAKVGSTINENPKSLAGKTIGVQSGSIQEKYMHTRLPDVNVKVYQTLTEAYLDLQAGRIDAVLDDKSSEYGWISTEGKKTGFDYVGKAVQDPDVFGPGTGIAVRKGDKQLLNKINGALHQIMADGTFARESAKVFPFSIAPTN